jgi:hypothetical protein
MPAPAQLDYGDSAEWQYPIATERGENPLLEKMRDLPEIDVDNPLLETMRDVPVIDDDDEASDALSSESFMPDNTPDYGGYDGLF